MCQKSIGTVYVSKCVNSFIVEKTQHPLKGAELVEHNRHILKIKMIKIIVSQMLAISKERCSVD